MFHQWEIISSNQAYRLRERHTRYECTKCHVSFLHFYHVEPDMLSAMSRQRVPQRCFDELQHKTNWQRSVTFSSLKTIANDLGIPWVLTEVIGDYFFDSCQFCYKLHENKGKLWRDKLLCSQCYPRRTK